MVTKRNCKEGLLVVRGEDWKFGYSDYVGATPVIGSITDCGRDETARVEWVGVTMQFTYPIKGPDSYSLNRIGKILVHH